MLETARQMVGRNDLCHCGSGRKYKRCCMAMVRPESARSIRLARGMGSAPDAEMREARKRGIENLLAEGKSAMELWGYMRTGGLFREGMSAVMLGNWSLAMEEYRTIFGTSHDRELVAAACIARLDMDF